MTTKFIALLLISVFCLLFLSMNFEEEMPSRYEEVPQKFHNDRKNLIESVNSLSEARDISNSMNILGQIKQEDEQEMIKLSKKGIELSNEIDDDFLDMLHPELKYYYREQLIKGAEMWLEGIENKDVSLQYNGAKKGGKWIDWFEENKYKVGRYLFR